MLSLSRLGQSVLAILVLATVSAAQGTMTVSDEVLTAGQSTTITFTDPNRAGQVVTVDVHDGDQVIDTLQIQLNADGTGSVDWMVPSGLDGVEFVADDGTATARPVE